MKKVSVDSLTFLNMIIIIHDLVLDSIWIVKKRA